VGSPPHARGPPPPTWERPRPGTGRLSSPRCGSPSCARPSPRPGGGGQPRCPLAVPIGIPTCLPAVGMLPTLRMRALVLDAGFSVFLSPKFPTQSPDQLRRGSGCLALLPPTHADWGYRTAMQPGQALPPFGALPPAFFSRDGRYVGGGERHQHGRCYELAPTNPSPCRSPSSMWVLGAALITAVRTTRRGPGPPMPASM